MSHGTMEFQQFEQGLGVTSSHYHPTARERMLSGDMKKFHGNAPARISRGVCVPCSPGARTFMDAQLIFLNLLSIPM